MRLVMRLMSSKSYFFTLPVSFSRVFTSEDA